MHLVISDRICIWSIGQRLTVNPIRTYELNMFQGPTKTSTWFTTSAMQWVAQCAI